MTKLNPVVETAEVPQDLADLIWAALRAAIRDSFTMAERLHLLGWTEESEALVRKAERLERLLSNRAGVASISFSYLSRDAQELRDLEDSIERTLDGLDPGASVSHKGALGVELWQKLREYSKRSGEPGRLRTAELRVRVAKELLNLELGPFDKLAKAAAETAAREEKEEG